MTWTLQVCVIKTIDLLHLHLFYKIRKKNINLFHIKGLRLK